MSSLQDRVLTSMAKFKLFNIEELFFNEKHEDRYQIFLQESFTPSDIEKWTFTGTWKYISGNFDKDKLNRVYSYTEGEETIYVKFFGYWSSFDGQMYDHFDIVVPKEVTTIIWETA